MAEASRLRTNGEDTNTPDFNSRDRYARGLKTTVGVLPPLRGSDVNSMSTVGCVHAFGVRCTHGWGPVAPTGLKSGVLPPLCRHYRREAASPVGRNISNHRQAPVAARSLWLKNLKNRARKGVTIHPKGDTLIFVNC